MSGTVYVQQAFDGRWFASLAELPGCMATGTTRDEAIARVRAAFPEYVALLARHGVRVEHVDGLDPAGFAVTDPPERMTYPEDFRGMEEHELRDFLHRFEALHAEVLDAVKGLTQEDLERKPAEGDWSVRETLEHIASGSLDILSRLEPWPKGDFATFRSAHRLVFQRFSVMDAHDAQGEHRVYGRRLSVKKVARRLLEHEFEHLTQIRETLARLSSR
jgi:predicted RNase H-like HicB family nuclease/uncharacterized damage-inducible protein DinB